MKADAPAQGEQLSFLPAPEFTPVWPEPGTMAAAALALFLDGASITHPEFEALTKSWRLAAAVFELRALGWPVETVTAQAPSNRTRCVARYRLPTQRIRQALALQAGRA